MRILAPDVRLPRVGYGGAHAPPLRASYRAFRPCLRWDFGFVCAACLLHERALGPEGWGQTTAEHVFAQSEDESRVDDYSNLLYLCRRCNSVRKNRARTDRRGRRLLDPRIEPWADHFVVSGDRIEPRPGDADAEYTEWAYDLNDPMKVEVRRRWREHRAKLLDVYWEAQQPLPKSTPASVRRLQRSTAAGLFDAIVQECGPIPPDSPDQCLCHPRRSLRLPQALTDLHVDLRPPAGLVKTAVGP